MKIAVIGERFIDRYHIGSASRLSPEAPVPVVKIDKLPLNLDGGAGNVSANLKALGAEVVEVAGSSTWPIKNRLMVGTHQIARWDEFDSYEEMKPAYLNMRRRELLTCDAFIISDYNKGAISRDTVKAISTILAEIGKPVPVFIDTKDHPAKYRMFWDWAYFFPNAKEYIANMWDYSQIHRVVRKESEKGITYIEFSNGLVHSPALAPATVSVSGAGDTVLAAFAYARVEGRSIEESLDFASRAAAVVVAKPFTAVATLEEISSFNYGR